MNIIDTYNKIFDCFENERFNATKYQQYADSILPNLYNKLADDAKSYDFNKEIFPVIQNTFENKEKLDLAHKIFLEVTKDLSKSIFEVFNEEIDVDIILYLGLCNGAGWATELNFKKLILLGVEKIVELGWYTELAMKGLIFHEVGHIYHYDKRLIKDNLDNCKNQSLFQLYSEGMAMYIEQLLCGDMSFYHQDVDGWLEWCKINHNKLYKMFLNKIDNNESTHEFFGDWNDIEGKNDVGYYLGCQLIKELAEHYSLKEMVNLDLITIERHLKTRCENV